MLDRVVIGDAAVMNDAIDRLADSIVRARAGANNWVLVGLYQHGVTLAERLTRIIEVKCGYRPPLAKLDITMYRDDIGWRRTLPAIRETDIPFDLDDATVVLVDDVLSSGRTIRAALDALTDYGRPRLIRLAVLVDRGHPEFPIRADYAGMAVACPQSNKVAVEFAEVHGADGIYEVEWRKD